MKSYMDILKFDEAKHPRDDEGQFASSRYSEATTDTLSVPGKSKKHVEAMIKSYGLALVKIKPDEEGTWAVTVQGDRSNIEHLYRDTDG